MIFHDGGFPGSHFWVPGPADWSLWGFYDGLGLLAAFPRHAAGRACGHDGYCRNSLYCRENWIVPLALRWCVACRRPVIAAGFTAATRLQTGIGSIAPF